MFFSRFSASVSRRSALTFLGAVALVGGVSLSAQATTFQMVDSQTDTGNMTIGVVSASYSGGQWDFTLKASNTGASTYYDVNLMLQFVWDQATNPESALSYTNSNSWSGVVLSNTDNFSFASYAIGAGPSSPLVPFAWTSANTPLSWTTPSQGLATVSSSDTLPTVPLGNFGPGATEDFSLVCPSNSFNPDVIGFYVAVPEPSTSVLLLAGGAGLLGYAVRRRKANA
jgi:hypothetical protein